MHLLSKIEFIEITSPEEELDIKALFLERMHQPVEFIKINDVDKWQIIINKAIYVSNIVANNFILSVINKVNSNEYAFVYRVSK